MKKLISLILVAVLGLALVVFTACKKKDAPVIDPVEQEVIEQIIEEAAAEEAAAE